MGAEASQDSHHHHMADARRTLLSAATRSTAEKLGKLRLDAAGERGEQAGREAGPVDFGNVEAKLMPTARAIQAYAHTVPSFDQASCR